MEAEKTYCLYCHKLLKGRSDKRYCNDECRNAFFNEKKKEEHSVMRDVELRLKKNRRILRDVLGEYHTKTTTEKLLLQKGFDFKYHTHHFTTRNADEYVFCFDYGYLAKEHGKIIVVKEIKNEE